MENHPSGTFIVCGGGILQSSSLNYGFSPQVVRKLASFVGVLGIALGFEMIKP